MIIILMMMTMTSSLLSRLMMIFVSIVKVKTKHNEKGEDDANDEYEAIVFDDEGDYENKK